MIIDRLSKSIIEHMQLFVVINQDNYNVDMHTVQGEE